MQRSRPHPRDVNPVGERPLSLAVTQPPRRIEGGLGFLCGHVLEGSPAFEDYAFTSTRIHSPACKHPVVNTQHSNARNEEQTPILDVGQSPNIYLNSQIKHWSFLITVEFPIECHFLLVNNSINTYGDMDKLLHLITLCRCCQRTV